MAQNQRRDGSDRLWLKSLIESFEASSCSDGRSPPCDRELLQAARAHLSIRKGPHDSEGKGRLVHAA
ncbi:hypothetical protein RPB_2459 [Rhodopseudomonas palustris HaA2]|uniref:Uncharacterized protein n=1 Tax=Rhodopseudomonas palustris (strain HaA2) TaxID=316058 RepID=Q2IX96_RHOP2|nr:hypothetical protein RPB_2459 [Rhodopseudomonas palustris HaA2]